MTCHFLFIEKKKSTKIMTSLIKDLRLTTTKLEY